AAIRFDSNDQWPADHAIWGSNDRYKKLLNYGEHDGYRSNLIVHGAKQYERNCSNIKNFVNSKLLIHHLTAEQRERLQANEENLQFSVNILKEWLINIAQAPNRLFALVVRFTPLFHVEYNPDYHYKELIRNKDGDLVKIVVIGWC
uniref:Uncharacterized protein n=1 Tax=Plectus sambesii TaxID=2011161 RepID=A0A914WMA0_9BILA